MSIFEAAILGLIQGLTEFIPVSSSGHLTIFPYLFGWDQPHEVIIFFAHTGTLIALIYYYRVRLGSICQTLLMALKSKSIPNQKEVYLLQNVAVATIVTLVVALLLDKFIEQIYTDEKLAPLVASFALVLVGTIFVLFDYFYKRTESRAIEKLGWRRALVLGAMQSVALFRGVSRSGMTLIGGQLLGLSKHDAADFSFMMSIPILTATTIYAMFELREIDVAEMQELLLASLVAAVTAGISGFFAVKYMLQYLKRNGLTAFGIYRIVLGLFVIIIISRNL